jgi:hypothetical protein
MKTSICVNFFWRRGQFPGEAARRAVGVGLLFAILSIVRVLERLAEALSAS